jgi:riboflavin kinase / FMN adenylyltransferase
MIVLRGLAEAPKCRNGVVAIGNFDGVHRGHKDIFALLKARAAAKAAPSVVMTFDPHPISVLRPGQTPPPLTTIEHKIALIGACGVDFLIVYPTDRELLSLSPRQFFDTIIVERLAAIGLVEGPNFFFGHDRAGSIETLAGFCAGVGIELQVAPPVLVGQRLVSSSEIRRLLQAGSVREAAQLLGYRYRVDGIVGTGAKRGRTIGFPTANVEQVRTLLPADGVYAGRVRAGENWHAAAINLGSNPTFAEVQRKLEAHLIDFSGDLYDQPLAVEFIDRLRETRPFASPQALSAQLQQDVERARQAQSTGSFSFGNSPGLLRFDP